jgi:hypothetical protein
MSHSVSLYQGPHDQNETLPRFANVAPPNVPKWLAIDISIGSFALVLLAFRFIQQYKVRATAVHQIIGHISIAISAAFFILAVFFSSAQSVLQSKWAPNAPDYTWTEKPPIYTPRGHRVRI